MIWWEYGFMMEREMFNYKYLLSVLIMLGSIYMLETLF